MVASASPNTRKRETTRSAILDATSDLISEKGIEGFTMSEVALRANVNRALIYHYFHDRDNLVVQTVDHVISRYEAMGVTSGTDAVERATRMFIEHPDLARFVYQLLLNGRPLKQLGDRFRQTVSALERLREEHAPESDFDPGFAFIMLSLSQIAWAFAREEIARLLNMTPQEADERFVACLRRETERGLAAVGGDA